MSDRLLKSLERLVRAIMRDTAYHKLYSATVQSQAADGTLDLLPDDEPIRGAGLSGVPIRHGLPGVTVRVPVGARVMLGFEAGDPQRPYAALWEPGQIISVSFDGGTRPIAYEGAPVICYWPPAVPVTGLLGGVPFEGVMTITSPAPGIVDGGHPQVLV